MPPLIAKHLDQKVRAAVDHLRMVGKTRLGVDHAEYFDDALDSVQRTENLFERRQYLQADLPGIRIAALDRTVASQTADADFAAGCARPLP